MQLATLLRMIPFEVERTACSKVNQFLKRRPSSEPFLSGDTFRAMADHVFDETHGVDPAAVASGSIAFVAAPRLRQFAAEVLPRINNRFVLITHQGDTNVDSSFIDIAENPKVLRWFAQNCLLEHPKVVPLPIGLENRWRHNNGALHDYRRMVARTEATIPRIAFAFNIRTNLAKRLPCYSALTQCDVADELPQPLNASLYRSSLCRYMFVASPQGNGLDCHRTWEAMYLKSVPIVDDNPMTRYYKSLGLPLVIVADWSELHQWTEEHATHLYTTTMNAANRVALFAAYWRNRILEAAQETT